MLPMVTSCRWQIVERLMNPVRVSIELKLVSASCTISSNIKGQLTFIKSNSTLISTTVTRSQARKINFDNSKKGELIISTCNSNLE